MTCACGKKHIGEFGSGRFCSRSCANKRVVRPEVKKYTCESCNSVFYIHKHGRQLRCHDCTFKKKLKACKYCGVVACNNLEICKSNSARQFLGSMIKYFGFNKNALGTSSFFTEFDSVKNRLLDEYFNQKLSTTELEKV